MKKIILSLILILSLPTYVKASDLPPKLGSEQVIFLTYKLAKETPDFAEWAAIDSNRSAKELERLFKITAERTDLSRFHRDLELALYGYDAKTEEVPLGEVKAAFLASPLLKIAGVEVHIDNADDFANWKLEPKEYQKIVSDNSNEKRYNFVSTLNVKGVNKTILRDLDNKLVLNLSWDKLYIYTKDKSKLLAEIDAE